MKKMLFRAIAPVILMFVGIVAAQAQQQKYYEVPPLSDEAKALADQVNTLNMEDPDAANKAFNKLIKKVGKSQEDLVAVGTYFLDNNNYPAAKQCADRVYELAPEYIEGLMFNGMVCMIRKDYGGAGQKFDAVLSINPDHFPALERNAFVYKNVNPYVAIETLNHMKELDPTYYNADKNLGDIYYKQDSFKDAVAAYKLYFAAVPKDTSVIDLRSCENYLQSLYALASFDEMLEVLPIVLPMDPNDLILRRMDFFAKVNKMGEAFDYDGAVNAATQAGSYVINKEYADTSYLYLDYEYAAALAKEKGDFPAAIGYFETALEIDPTKASGYKELSTLYARNKQAEQGIAAYAKYLEILGDKADLSDRFLLGTKYMAAYQEEGIEESKKQEYFNLADGIFAEVMEEKPDYVQAIIFRARLNNTDSQTPNDTVRDLYQKVLDQSAAEPEKSANQRYEACRYLFFYAVSMEPEDVEGAQKAYEIAKEIKPEDSFVKNAELYLQQIQ